MPQNIYVGRGDNAPDPVWQFAIDLTGSTFELDVRVNALGLTFAYTSEAGDLVVDLAGRTVTWILPGTLSEMFPFDAQVVAYALRRVVPGGDVQTFAGGLIRLVEYPVNPSLTTAVVAGPQGPPGSGGLTVDQVNALIASAIAAALGGGVRALSTALSGAGSLIASTASSVSLASGARGAGILSAAMTSAAVGGAALAAALQGTSSLSGVMGQSLVLAAALAGTPTLSAAMASTPAGTAALVATMKGAGTLSGALSQASALGATLTGKPTLSAAMTSAAPGAALSASIVGAGAMTAAPTTSTTLAATAPASSAMSAGMSAASTLSAAPQGKGAASGTMTSMIALAVAARGTGALSATLAGPPVWTQQSAITMTNSTASAPTGYQSLIKLTSANFNFANAKSDGSDIRVTDSDQSTNLPIWIESFDPVGQTGRVWVASALVASGAKTLYLYYGNAAASSTSNGNTVFSFFDDFSGTTPGWNRYEQTNPLIKTVASTWKSSIAGDPLVIPPDAGNSNWGAFFNGATGTSGDIGYMSSPDGITWTEYGSNPVFTHTTAGMDYAIKPSVVYDSATGNYYMAYAGQLGGGNWHLRRAKATSRTGPWTDLGSMLTPDSSSAEGTRLDCPCWFKDGSTIKLYYSGNSAVANEPKNWCLATTTGTFETGTFTRYSGNPIATPPSGSTYFGNGLGGMSVRKLANNTYDFAFNGFDSSAVSWMGRLNSPDGVTVTVSDSNLLFGLGPQPNAWDRVKLYRPCIYTTSDNVDRLLYNALGDSEQIGYAEYTTTPYNLSKWTPYLQGTSSLNAVSGVLKMGEASTTNLGAYFLLGSAYAPAADTVIDVRMRVDSISDGSFSEWSPFLLVDSGRPIFSSVTNAQWAFVSKNSNQFRHQNKSGGSYGGEDTIYAGYPTTGTWYRYRMNFHAASLDYYLLDDTGAALGSLVGNTDAPQGATNPLAIGGHGAQVSYDSLFARKYLSAEPTVAVGTATTVSKSGL